jgi:hypothetical protein
MQGQVEPASPEGGTTQYSYGQALPDVVSAANWQPEGAEGLAQISVPTATLLTLHSGGERVHFPAGVYTVPRFIRYTKVVWNPQTNGMDQLDARMAIAGDYDEAKHQRDGDAMHPHLRRVGVKRSGQQPVEEPEASSEGPEQEQPLPLTAPAPEPPATGARPAPPRPGQPGPQRR